MSNDQFCALFLILLTTTYPDVTNPRTFNEWGQIIGCVICGGVAIFFAFRAVL